MSSALSSLAGWLARNWWKLMIAVFGSIFAGITIYNYMVVSGEVSKSAQELAPLISTIMIIMMLMIVLYPLMMMFQMFIGMFRW